MSHHPHKGDPAVLQTFDPATFYPALAAREKLKHTRDDSCTTFPSAKSIAEPQIPKDFDPAVFYSALAAREKAKVVGGGGGANSSGGEDHSIFTESINPGDSISYSHLPRVEQQQVVVDPWVLPRLFFHQTLPLTPSFKLPSQLCYDLYSLPKVAPKSDLCPDLKKKKLTFSMRWDGLIETASGSSTRNGSASDCGSRASSSSSRRSS